MSFNYVLFILVGLGVLAAVSVFLGVLNWFQLMTTSSAINRLQTEIDKKYQEKDSRKKDAPHPNTEEFYGIVPSSERHSVLPSPAPASAQQEPQIEIVRNVRGGYAVTEQAGLTKETFPTPHKENPPLKETGENVYRQPQPVPESSVSYRQLPLSYPPDNAPSDVLEVVDESSENISTRQQGTDSFIIPLYSKASQDADFSSLWKKLTQVLERSPDADIQVDFKNILFLYEKEIEYLCKIYETVTLRKGRLSFIHCSPELISILNKEPRLKNIILKET